MKILCLTVAALVAACLMPVTRAGQLSLSSGFALAQNSDGGGSARDLIGARSAPLAESPIRSDLGVASSAGYLREVGDGTVINPPDIDAVARPSIATAPDAVGPVVGPRGNVAGALVPNPPRHADAHRWQSLVPGAIK